MMIYPNPMLTIAFQILRIMLIYNSDVENCNPTILRIAVRVLRINVDEMGRELQSEFCI